MTDDDEIRNVTYDVDDQTVEEVTRGVYERFLEQTPDEVEGMDPDKVEGAVLVVLDEDGRHHTISLYTEAVSNAGSVLFSVVDEAIEEVKKKGAEDTNRSDS